MARSVITRADASPSYIIPTNGPAFLRMHHQSATKLSLFLSYSLAGDGFHARRLYRGSWNRHEPSKNILWTKIGKSARAKRKRIIIKNTICQLGALVIILPQISINEY